MIYSFDKDFSKVTFVGNEKGILGESLDKTNLEDDNNDPGIIYCSFQVFSLAQQIWKTQSTKSQTLIIYCSFQVFSLA